MIKVKNLRWLFVGLLAISTGAVWINPPTTLGVTVETSDGQYYFAGGTQPWALSLAALIILAYFVLMYAEPSPNRIPLKGLLRRFAAFWLDLFTCHDGGWSRCRNPAGACGVAALRSFRMEFRAQYTDGERFLCSLGGIHRGNPGSGFLFFLACFKISAFSRHMHSWLSSHSGRRNIP